MKHLSRFQGSSDSGACRHLMLSQSQQKIQRERKSKQEMMKNSKGFTLTELIIAISVSIVLIVASIGLYLSV
ncbi:MAG: prepilin-type N-terminal cleavage/methylation domain-containing protein, partial [Candidatus Saccharimonadales bacterium]